MSLKKARASFFLFLFLLTCFLCYNPGHNGDMSFYIATALNFQGHSEQQSLAGAKEVILSELGDREAVHHVANLDHAPSGILDFYRIKPVYIGAVNVLHRLGLPFITATLIPSWISFFLIGCLVLNWALKILKPTPAVISSVILMLMYPSVVIGRLSTPDALSNLFIFLCLFRIYFGKNYLWTILLLSGSLFIRIDNFISVVILLALMFFLPAEDEKKRMPLLLFISAVLLSGAACAWENYYFTSNFWWFRQITYSRSLPAYKYQVLIYFYSVSISYIPVLALMTGLAFFNSTLATPKKACFMMASIAAVILFRFILFPSFEERFFTAYYLSGFLIVLELLSVNHPLRFIPGKIQV